MDTDSITARLTEFISAPREYAVLLNGPWGIGKTYYYRNAFSALPGDKAKKSPIFVSLFGVSSTADFDRRLVESVAPFLDSAVTKSAGRIAESAAGFFGVSLNCSYSDFVALIKGRVAFIDDLERCKMDMREVFGYIDNLISKYEIRAVLVGNEAEFAKGDKDYKSWKEKLIGFTFEYRPNVKAVSEHIVTQALKPHTTLGWSKDYLLREYERLVLDRAPEEQPNFRTLKVAIDLWTSIAPSLPDLEDRNCSAYEWVIRTLFGIITETRKDEDAWKYLSPAFHPSFDLSKFQLETAFAEVRANRNGQEGQIPPNPLNDFIGRYLSNAPATVFQLHELASIVKTGQFDSTKFAKQFALLVTGLQGPAPTPAIEKLLTRQLWTLSDEQRLAAASEAISQLRQNTILDLRQLVQIVDTLTFLAESRLIHVGAEEIAKVARESLKSLEAQGRVIPDSAELDMFRFSSPSTTVKDIAKAAVELGKRIKDAKRAAVWRELFEAVLQEGHTFDPLARDGDYTTAPVFQVLDPGIVIEAAKKMGTEKLFELSTTLHSRYNYGNVRDFMMGERENLAIIGTELRKIAQATATPRSIRDYALEQVADEINSVVARLS